VPPSSGLAKWEIPFYIKAYPSRSTDVFVHVTYVINKITLVLGIVTYQVRKKDQQAADAASINAFKGRLNRIRETRMGFFMD